MPFYSYKCEKCEKEVDKLVSFSNADEQVCDCEEDGTARLIRQETVNKIGFILKGSGYYGKGRS